MNFKTLSAEKIASIVDGDLFLSTAQEFTGINSLSDASPEEVSFLGNEKYYQEFLSSQAGLVLAPLILKEAPSGMGVIHVENPTLAFTKIISYFSEQQEALPFEIAPSAVIATSAVISEEVYIGPGVIIGEGVRVGRGSVIHAGVVIADHSSIGEHTLIYQNVVVRERSVIGAHVILQPGCVIGSDGFGYELIEGKHQKIPQVGSVVIEDEVEVGANTTIDRARFGKTVIGAGTKIDNLVQIAHNVSLGSDNLMIAQSGIAGSAQTGAHVIVGAQGGVSGHIKLGDGVVVAGQSGLAKSVELAGYYQGTPARPLRDSRKSKALVNRLPKLMARLKALEDEVSRLSAQDASS